MPQPYTDYYIWPPRTKARIPFAKSPVLDMWRKFPDAVAQFKLNGNRNLIKVKPDRTIEFWNRHQERQQYAIPDDMRERILAASPEGHYTVWDSELLHTKTKDVKNTIYVFDCLVWESQHLTECTYQDRMAIVYGRFGSGPQTAIPFDAVNVNKQRIYVAEMIPPTCWDKAWADAKTCSHVEGLVLKRTGGSSRLTYGGVELNNGGFMCRIRKYNKNANF